MTEKSRNNFFFLNWECFSYCMFQRLISNISWIKWIGVRTLRNDELLVYLGYVPWLLNFQIKCIWNRNRWTSNTVASKHVLLTKLFPITELHPTGKKVIIWAPICEQYCTSVMKVIIPGRQDLFHLLSGRCGSDPWPRGCWLIVMLVMQEMSRILFFTLIMSISLLNYWGMWRKGNILDFQ